MSDKNLLKILICLNNVPKEETQEQRTLLVIPHKYTSSILNTATL